MPPAPSLEPPAETRLVWNMTVLDRVESKLQDKVRLTREDALVKAPALSAVKLVAAVSPDVDLDDRESLLWGIFTRFDPARDVVFASVELHGAWPVSRGPLGIDATFKRGYPETIVMDPAISKRVDARWHQYWTA